MLEDKKKVKALVASKFLDEVHSKKRDIEWLYEFYEEYENVFNIDIKFNLKALKTMHHDLKVLEDALSKGLDDTEISL